MEMITIEEIENVLKMCDLTSTENQQIGLESMSLEPITQDMVFVSAYDESLRKKMSLSNTAVVIK